MRRIMQGGIDCQSDRGSSRSPRWAAYALVVSSLLLASVGATAAQAHQYRIEGTAISASHNLRSHLFTGTFAFLGTPFAVAVHISCTKAQESGTIGSSGAGTASFEFRSCSVTKPANCTVKEPIAIETTTSLVGPEPGTEIESKPKGGTAFATITLEGASCALKGKPFEITGSQDCALPGGETEALGHEIACSTSGSKLEAAGKAATYEGTISGLELESGAKWSVGAGSSPPPSPPVEELGGAGSNPGQEKVEKCTVGKEVNCATGDEVEQQTDLAVHGRGPGLRVVRSYDALAAAKAGSAGVWGFGWTGSYDVSLSVGSETATVHQENGSPVVFYKSGTAWTQGAWTEARLVKEGTNYVYTLATQLKLEFNGEGQLVKETDRSGNALTFAYNVSKQLETVTDGAGRKLTFKYNGEGLVESIKDPMGHVVSYTYSSKQLASVTIEGKVRWKFEYTSPHLLSKVTDGREHVTSIEYDASDRVIKEERAGHTRKWSYGSKETTLTEPNGSETVETFNEAGEPTKITRAKGVAGVETTSEYEYSSTTYNLLKKIDGLKHETTYGYDEEGNRTSEKDPAGDERKWKYDKKHDLESETSPEGETTTIKLTASGLPEVVERPIGEETQKTKYKYAENGDLSEETDPLANVTKLTYDEYGDRASEKDAEGDERKYKYNEDGQLTEETSPRGFVTKYELDEQGRRKKVTDPLGHTTKYVYDGNGNTESETDGNEHTTKTTYNEEDLPTKVEQPNKTIVETGYDAEGQKTSYTDGNKHVWEYKRNQLEQVAEEKTPLGKLTKKKYDKAGNLESLEDPEKHTTEYGYDEANRLTKVKYSTGKPSEVKYTYNKDSKVTVMTDETGETKNTWDKLDRLTEAKNGAGKVVKYEYNLANEPTKITYPNEKAVTRSYDKARRLEKIKDWNSHETSFKYNKDSQPEKTIFPGTENEDTYAYNEADQMTEIHYKHGAASLGTLTYTRDNDGQLKKTTITGFGTETSEAAYDENNRLIEGGGRTDEYDAANNPTKIEGTAGYTYNEADQLEKGPGTGTYTYNEDGRRTKTKPETGPATTYGYDQAGNLTTVERPEEGITPKIEDSYKYDGTNLRQAQVINGTTTHLTWDTAEALPVLLTDETNSYIYGAGGVPVEQISSGGTTLYLHHDQQNSTRLLTNTTGESEASYTYYPYGAIRATTGTATTPLRYDGQYTSSDTGLIYLRARVYDPQTAQLLTDDPLLEVTGEPYNYAADNPVNGGDPSGEGPDPLMGPMMRRFNPRQPATRNFRPAVGRSRFQVWGVVSRGVTITRYGFNYTTYILAWIYAILGTEAALSMGPANPYFGFGEDWFGIDMAVALPERIEAVGRGGANAGRLALGPGGANPGPGGQVEPPC